MTDDERRAAIREDMRAAVREVADAAPEAARREVAKQVSRRWRWLVIGVVAWLVALTVGTALFDQSVNRRQAAAEARQVATDQNVSAARAAGDQANAELRKQGRRTVPIPDPSQAQAVDVIKAAVLAQVMASTPAGRVGATGAVGPGGPVGPQGPTGKQGNPGAAGGDGTDGADGRNGADGQNGNTGAPGRDGANGQPGQDGQDGAPGRDGKPPTAWTFTYAGLTYTCTRNNTDDQAPTYACTTPNPTPILPVGG